MTLQTVSLFSRDRWPRRDGDAGRRPIAEETPVAIVHNGTTSAVLMATPTDLEDFAIGFSFTEGAIADVADVDSLEVLEVGEGVEARLWLGDAPAELLARRRRRLAGPTGCGLCGVESLAEAVRKPPVVVSHLTIAPDTLLAGMEALSDRQAIGRSTRAVHAAGLWRDTTLVCAREDVGRHNALDKLIGACLRSGAAPGDGVVLLTSRVSVEMVQKAAWFGASIVCAVSAPTALAIRLADEVGLTLVAVCRADGFEVFTHPQRIGLT